MPFFYSQYVGDEKKAKPKPAVRGAQRGKSDTAPAPAPAPSAKPKSPARPGVPRQRSLNRLVWHSNVGSASSKKTKPAVNFNPLKYNAKGKKSLTVHFSTIEVQPFHFDWDLADQVFYSRKELTIMGQCRFDDAAKLRQQRHVDEIMGNGNATDDVGTSTKSKERDIATLLTIALEDKDEDDKVSIRGIEHFVYPDLQQEMIRRKKEVQREVLDFVRSKRPDPQGWRLAQHSRTFSQWAQNVALEKGMKYCMNTSSVDPDVQLSDDDLEMLKKSSDELEASVRSMRGSRSFQKGGYAKSFSHSFDAAFDVHEKNSFAIALKGLREKAGEHRVNELDDSQVSQPPGANTEED